MLAARRMMFGASAPTQITFVGQRSNLVSGSTAPTITGLAVGDYMLCHTTARANGTWTTPSGWTQLRQDHTSDLYLTTFGKVAASGDLTSIGTFTSSGTAGYGVFVVSAWRHVDATTPVADSGSATFIYFPQLAGVDKGMYVGYVGWGWNASSAPGVNSPLSFLGQSFAAGEASWGMGGYHTAVAGTDPAGSTDFSFSLGTSPTVFLNHALILNPT